VATKKSDMCNYIIYIEVTRDFHEENKEQFPENFPERSWVWYNRGYGTGFYYYYFRGTRSHPLYKAAVLNQADLLTKGVSREDLPEGIVKMIPNNLSDEKIQNSPASHSGKMIIERKPYGYVVNDLAYNEKGKPLAGINPAEIRRKEREALNRKVRKRLQELLESGKVFRVRLPNGEVKTQKVVLREPMWGGEKQITVLRKDDGPYGNGRFERVDTRVDSECPKLRCDYLLDGFLGFIDE